MADFGLSRFGELAETNVVSQQAWPADGPLDTTQCVTTCHGMTATWWLCGMATPANPESERVLLVVRMMKPELGLMALGLRV
jgi:hypothetical protein